MSYIGRGTESISNVEVLDNLTFDGSASYTLQKSSTNFVPSSANNLLISISGVVQQGNFSVSGSTITFDTTVSASDTCDWILHYGTGLITTVADGAITEAKLGSNAVTTAKINNGAITSAKLDSGLALGKIGSFTSHSDHSQRTTTSNSLVDSGITEQSVTAINANAKFHINLFANLRAQNGQMEATVFYKVGSGSYANFQPNGGRTAFMNLYPNSGNNETVSCAGSFTNTLSNTAGDTIYFKIYFKSHTANTVELVGDLSPTTIQIMEVLA